MDRGLCEFVGANSISFLYHSDLALYVLPIDGEEVPVPSRKLLEGIMRQSVRHQQQCVYPTN